MATERLAGFAPSDHAIGRLGTHSLANLLKSLVSVAVRDLLYGQPGASFRVFRRPLPAGTATKRRPLS